MNRQGSNSFSIDNLISSPFSSRFGSMMYNNGFVFMPPTSSAMLQFAQAPYGRFPLMPPATNIYQGHFHSAFTNTGIGNYVQSDSPYSLSDYVNKSKKKLPDSPPIMPTDHDDGADDEDSYPRDLRIATTCPTDADGEDNEDDVMSESSIAGM